MHSLLKVVFLPNFCISQAEKVIPALDVAEMTSKPGTEAYGATNLKMMMNGVVMLSSHDGMNELVYQKVGPDNMVMFGRSETDIDMLNAGLETRKKPQDDSQLVSAI